MMKLERMIEEFGEAIDGAVLDPTRWQAVLDTLQGLAPGVKAVLHVEDVHLKGAIGLVHSGFDDKLLSDYQQHYSKINPWVPFLARAPTMQVLVSDDQLPSSSFRETEFYRDWIVPEGEIESAVGIKLVQEPDRFGMLAIHFGTRMADRYNHLLARVVQDNAVRLRRSVDAARLAVARAAARPGPVPLDVFPLPALLLDGRGKVLEFNDAAGGLIAAQTLRLGVDGTLRLAVPSACSERIVTAARQVAANRGRWSQGGDFSVPVADGSRLTVSLFAVRGSDVVVAGIPPFFAPPRLTLVLVRSGGHAANDDTCLKELYGLTAAELRLAAQLSAGLPLQQCGLRLGIGYETVRSQLKAVFAKTGTSRQAELVALLARVAR